MQIICFLIRILFVIIFPIYFILHRSTFPLSWFVSALLDQLHRCNDIGSLEAAFMSTATGQIVAEVTRCNIAALRAIIIDLVHIKIGGKMAETVLNIVCEEVYKSAKCARTEKNLGTNSSNDDIDEDEFVTTLTSQPLVVDIYEAVSVLRPRLQLCVSLFNLVPGLVEKMISDESSSIDNVFSLDMRVLHEAFSHLDPKGGDMLSAAARQDWSDRLISLSVYAKQLEGLVSRDQANSQLMTSVRQRFQRAEIIKLFFHCVLHEDVNSLVRETVCQHLRLLFGALRDPDFVSGPQTFNKVKQVVDNYCKKVGEALLDSKGIRECIICLEAIQMPVILTCGHVTCQSCLQDHFQMTRTRVCSEPSCQRIIPDDFRVHSEAKILEAVEEHARFRKYMTQFFIELLQCHVFVDHRMPHDDIVKDLVSFIVTKQLPKDSQSSRTKQLSPFPGDLIDPQPVVRSFLLQLILKYDLDHVEGHLQQLLQEKEGVVELRSQFPELCSLIITCMEDTMRSSSCKGLASGRKDALPLAFQHLATRLERDFDPGVSLVRSLMITAGDRLAINTVGQAVHDCLTGATANDDDAVVDLMKIAQEFVHNHPQCTNVKKYLVRFVAANYQQNAVVEWKRRNVFRDLLPEDLRNASANNSPDVFLILDNDYRTVRNAVSQAWLSGDYAELTKVTQIHWNKTRIWFLAFHTLTSVNRCVIRDPAVFDTFLGGHPRLQTIWASVGTCRLPPVLVAHNHRLASVHNLLVHFTAVLSEPKLSQLVHVLRQLAQNPENCGALYLPTMPQDETLEAKAAVTGPSAWYQCLNGHAYAIGECGRPVQASKCPTCGAPIGGVNYQFHGTQLPAQLVDSTRPGHLLGEAASTRAVTVREISGMDVAVIRCMLHVAMLAGSLAKSEAVRALISPRPDNRADSRGVGDFLTAHLLLNLTQIGVGLGRCEDDVIVLLHQIVDSFAKQTTTAAVGFTLNSKAAVWQWEKEFVRQFIRPALANLDTKLAAHRTAVKDDKEEANNVLLDILFEEPVTSSTIEDMSQLLSLPQLWQPRSDTITLARLESKLGGGGKFKEQCPMLFHLVTEECRLEEVVHLPELLQLARFMVTNFNRKFEPAETSDGTVEQFVMKYCGSGQRKWVLSRVKTFFAVFHRLQAMLFSFNW